MKPRFLALILLFITACGGMPVADDNISESWTFDHSENFACLTVKQVVEHDAPVLMVSHDAGDHGWQFLTGGDLHEKDAMILSLGEMVKIDPTILNVGAMPPGHYAVRKSVGEKWLIQKR